MAETIGIIFKIKDLINAEGLHIIYSSLVFTIRHIPHKSGEMQIKQLI